VIMSVGHGDVKESFVAEMSLKSEWLKRCLPIIVQPKIDIENNNHLIKVMYEFFTAIKDENKHELCCRLHVIYSSESSYNRSFAHKHNTVATFFYRSFNRMVHQRTSDINYLEYRGVDLRPESKKPWRSIFTHDHAGTQSWSQGNKRNIGNWFSLMYHYRVNSEYHRWVLEEHRPYIYVNTCNHMWGERDNNPRMDKYFWSDYSFDSGDYNLALEYSKNYIPTKHNLYSILFFCFATNGGNCCDRQTRQLRSHRSGTLQNYQKVKSHNLERF